MPNLVGKSCAISWQPRAQAGALDSDLAWGTPGYVSEHTETLLALIPGGLGNTTSVENTYDQLTTPADEELQARGGAGKRKERGRGRGAA